VAKMKRTVRLGQSVMPFGVGAIYDVFGESFAACDIGLWGQRGKSINSPALKQHLGLAGLRSAPTLDDVYHGVPYVRFPTWMFCQKCRTLFRWSRQNEREDEPAICISCTGVRQLVPMRFVLACSNGHLGDVPWHRWAHSSAKANAARCDGKTLTFRGISTGGSGLSSLIVGCKKCNASRSLAGLTAKDSVQYLGVKCTGTQPWQLRASVAECAVCPQVIQRGASNIYFADVASSIEIPNAQGLAPFDELRTTVESHPLVPSIKYFSENGDPGLTGPFATDIMAKISADTKANGELVKSILLTEASPVGAIDFMEQEWLALRTPRSNEDGLRSDFMTRHTTLTEGNSTDPLVAAIDGRISNVVLVTRLKEVRALKGFTRLDPGNTQLRPDLTRVGSTPRINWAPAVEVYGEGIFVTLDEQAVSSWEKSAVVLDRISRMQSNISHSSLGKSILRQRLGREDVLARFVLLHTLAHLLIRELCFECGYSSASLRERIYSRAPEEGAPQAGVLVFTAAGDAEGTFGGLVRQGEPPRLLRSIVKALDTACWCSADPICRESKGQGYDSTNLAACHACSLLPETSCVTGNMLLDRSLLIGGQPGVGSFFNEQTLASAART
jgi:hypothetical protein